MDGSRRRHDDRQRVVFRGTCGGRYPGARGTGATVTIRTYLNGVQVGADVLDTNAARLTSGNFVGIWNIFANHVWDDFTVDDLAAGGGGGGGPLIGSRLVGGGLLGRRLIG